MELSSGIMISDLFDALYDINDNSLSDDDTQDKGKKNIEELILFVRTSMCICICNRHFTCLLKIVTPYFTLI